MGAYHSIEDAELVIEGYAQERYLSRRFNITAWNTKGSKNGAYWMSKKRCTKIPTEFYNRDKSGWFY
tara:strand:+ start:63 stop:263 length:201 start_codon:yes stop_codon:yes gene_type:complete